jgi:hypothetical protein
MTPLSEHAAVVEAANKAWRFGYNKDFGEDNMRDIIADAVAKVCEPLLASVKSVIASIDEMAAAECHPRPRDLEVIRDTLQAALNPQRGE